MTSNSLVDSFPTQFHLLGYGMAQSKLPSSSRQPSLARETTAAHKNQMYGVSEGPAASENLHVNENPDAGKASHPVIETSTNLVIKEQAMRNGLMKPGPQVTSIYQDSQATLNDKVAVSSF